MTKMSAHGFDEDFNKEVLPYNPILMETVHDFLEKQKEATKAAHGKYSEFECRGCGDCCVYNYYGMNVDSSLMDKLYTTGLKDFYGYWILTRAEEDPGMGTQLHCYMPIPGAKKKELRMFHFSGNLSPDQYDFLIFSGRRHGYWVMRDDGKLLIYNPAKCIHYEEGLGCDAYDKRPKVCRIYFCGRYPKAPEPQVQGVNQP